EVYSDVLYPTNGDLTSGNPINVTSGATTSNINFALTPASAAGGISGTITNAGTAAAVATSVYVFDSAGNYLESVGSNGGTGAWATTLPLKTGTYYVWAIGTLGLIGELYDNIPCMLYTLCSVTSSTPVSVTAGSVTSGINIALSP